MKIIVQMIPIAVYVVRLAVKLIRSLVGAPAHSMIAAGPGDRDLQLSARRGYAVFGHSQIRMARPLTIALVQIARRRRAYIIRDCECKIALRFRFDRPPRLPAAVEIMVQVVTIIVLVVGLSVQ